MFKPAHTSAALLLAIAAAISPFETPTVETVAGKALAQLRGSATFRERLTLPPDAVFEAALEDVSRADAPADVMGRTRIENPGNPPIRFAIDYDSTRIVASRRHAVRARILVRGELFFTSDTNYPVLTGGNPSDVSILLRRAGASGVGLLGALPATFAGDLPCADCPGMRYQLELLPDEAFFLRITYLERNDTRPADNIGRWAVRSDKRILTLFGAGDPAMMFAIESPNVLRKLDLDGRDIASSLNYDLTRTTSQPALEPRLSMRGMYRYMAEAGRFSECLTRLNVPVAQEHANAELESAYAKVRREPGEEILVNVEGRLTMRPRMEGSGQQRTLVVERFLGVWPGETC